MTTRAREKILSAAHERLRQELAATPGVAAEETATARTGIDYAWQAEKAALPEIAPIFARHTYFLEMMTCVDLRESDGVMRLVYTFNRFGERDRHRVRTDLPAGEPWAAPTISGSFCAADWFEREVFDMYGVRFDGHPDLRRLLLPDDADFHPLLKDFGRKEDAEGGS